MNHVPAFEPALDLALSPDSVLAVRDGGASRPSTYDTICGYTTYPLTAGGQAAEEISLRAFIPFVSIVYIFERYDAKGQYKTQLISSAACVLTRRNELLDRVLKDGWTALAHSLRRVSRGTRSILKGYLAAPAHASNAK